MLRLIKISQAEAADQPETSSVASAAAPAVMIAREFAHPRLEIMRLLHEACEIEHSLMVQYLYAAFSIKPEYADLAGTPNPARSDCLLGVAVQEMKHFREVNEMLVGFGGQPNMERQDFPYEIRYQPNRSHRLANRRRLTAGKFENRCCSVSIGHGLCSDVCG